MAYLQTKPHTSLALTLGVVARDCLFSLLSAANVIRMETKSVERSDKNKWANILEGFYLPINPLIFLLFPIYGVTRCVKERNEMKEAGGFV